MFLSKSLKLVPKKEVHVFQWPLLDLSRKVGLGIHWNGISRKWYKSLEETFPYPSQSGSLKFASKELHAEVSNHTRQWPPACQCDHASAPRPTPRICANQGVLGSCADSTWTVRTWNSSQLTSSYNGTYLLQDVTSANSHNLQLSQASSRHCSASSSWATFTALAVAAFLHISIGFCFDLPKWSKGISVLIRFQSFR